MMTTTNMTTTRKTGRQKQSDDNNKDDSIDGWLPGIYWPVTTVGPRGRLGLRQSRGIPPPRRAFKFQKKGGIILKRIIVGK